MSTYHWYTNDSKQYHDIGTRSAERHQYRFPKPVVQLIYPCLKLALPSLASCLPSLTSCLTSSTALTRCSIDVTALTSMACSSWFMVASLVFGFVLAVVCQLTALWHDVTQGRARCRRAMDVVPQGDRHPGARTTSSDNNIKLHHQVTSSSDVTSRHHQVTSAR